MRILWQKYLYENGRDKIALPFCILDQKRKKQPDSRKPVDPRPRIEVKGLNLSDAEGVRILKNVSFTARGGEILGIAGIAGSGQKELLECIAGLQKPQTGEIIFTNPKKNRPVTFFHKQLGQIRHMAAQGLFHDPDGNTVKLGGLFALVVSALLRSRRKNRSSGRQSWPCGLK